MEHHFAALNASCQQVGIEDGSANEVDARQVLQVRYVAAGQIVHDDDLGAEAKERACQMRADKARTTRDKRFDPAKGIPVQCLPVCQVLCRGHSTECNGDDAK